MSTSKLTSALIATSLSGLLAACTPRGSTSHTETTPVVAGVHIFHAVQHDISAALRDIPPANPDDTVHEIENEPLPRLREFAPLSALDPAIQSNAGANPMPAPLSSFEGQGNGFSGPQGTFSVQGAPSDTDGDVGPNHYVQVVNLDLTVFNRSGTPIYGPVVTKTLWTGFGGPCEANNNGDAVVKYDKAADRWIVSQFSIMGNGGGMTPAPPYLECVAVSTTPDPTGSYARYSFTYPSFNDYPKLSVWSDAYYATFNLFGGTYPNLTFAGADVCAYDRNAMLAGRQATMQCFQLGSQFGGLLPSDLDGRNPPPSGSPAFALMIDTNDLKLWKFHVDWATPANSSLNGPTSIPVAGYSPLCNASMTGTCIPQKGTDQQLDSLSDRLMYRLAYRNFRDHESLVVSHSVAAGSGGGVRWYEIRSPGGTPALYQQGTYAPDGNYRWMGSAAMDQDGNLALGFSVSGSGIKPQIHYTGRLATDPLGQLTFTEASLVDGGGSQTAIIPFLQPLSRWGDYAAMAVDPTDDCTFWFTSEYHQTDGSVNWNTRIGSFKFPSCGGTCTPACGVRKCGDDGCGGTCGTCSAGQMCLDGTCGICTPSCSGKTCGDDGCGGTCGNCAANQNCQGGQCVASCTPTCPALAQCGDDGCGGQCGSGCMAGQFCFFNVCF